MLQEARWLTRGLSMRYETLLRTTRVIVERQTGFLVHGDEALAPLTLKEVADATYGQWLLVLLALGMVAFGLYSFAEARWRRILGS